MKIVQSLLEQLQAVKDIPKKYPQIKDALDKALGMNQWESLPCLPTVYSNIPHNNRGISIRGLRSALLIFFLIVYIFKTCSIDIGAIRAVLQDKESSADGHLTGCYWKTYFL